MPRFIRLVCALMSLALLGIPAQAEAQTPSREALEQMPLEALYELRAMITEVIEAQESAIYQTEKFESGTYKVGKDLPAGTYVIFEDENALFSSMIVRDRPDDSGVLIAYELITNQAVARLAEGVYVTLTEANAYLVGGSEAADPEDVLPLGEGGYLVGTHLPAGSYTVTPAGKAPLSSFSVFDGVLLTDAQLLNFQKITEPTELTLENGQYVELSGCMIDH